MIKRRPGLLTRRLLRAPAKLYDWHLGWLLDQRFLRLTHVGRYTGQPHQTLLEVIGTGPCREELLVIAGLGRRADWYRNLLAHPATEVAIGHRRFRPAYRVLDASTAATALADYEQRNRWLMPIVRRVLSRLVGWDYDGSPSARQQLVSELPIVAFRPTESAPP